MRLHFHNVQEMIGAMIVGFGLGTAGALIVALVAAADAFR